jgi:phage-related holin
MDRALNAKALLIALTGFFAPIAPLLLAAFAVVFLDTVLGVLAAWKQKKKISSHAFSRSISKLLVYLTLILFGHIVGTLLLPEYPLMSFITSYIGIAETLSVLEKMNILAPNTAIGKIIDTVKKKNDE